MGERNTFYGPPEPGGEHDVAAGSVALQWHQSLVIKGALVASVILFAGYVGSFFISFESINSISRLSYDEEIDTALASSLNQIKRTHMLSQELAKLKVGRQAEEFLKSNTDYIDKNTIRSWLVGIHLDPADKDKALKFTQLSSEILPEQKEEPAKWVSRQSLQVLNYQVDFPKGKIYQDFRYLESVVKRYQFIGTQLEEDVIPVLLRGNAFILILGFLFLSSSLFLLARSFQKQVKGLILGLETWGKGNYSFRFNQTFPGELSTIASYFNTMAESVEKNQKRSLYLEKVASWQVIARKLAHEIKNPLTPIQMMVSQLNRYYKGEDEKYTKLLDNAQTIIQEEVASLRRMVDSFSNFARLPLPEFNKVDIYDLCEKVVAMQKASFPEVAIELEEREPMQGSYEVFADSGLIKQVLVNLVKNAAEAGLEAEDGFDIKVSIFKEKSFYKVVVADTGPGIPEDIQKRIFEAYFTTKHTGPTAGMGLGLAVCQKIVLDHGGDLLVESRPKKTEFFLTLPIHTGSQSDRGES